MTSRLRSSLWIGTLAAGVLALAASWQAGFTLAPGSVPLSILFAGAAAICWCRPPERFGSLRPLVELLEGFVLLTVSGVFGALLAYAIVRQVPGFHDALFDRADAAIGFRWPAVYAFVAARPRLPELLLQAYLSFAVMPFPIFALLGRAGRTDHLYRFLLANGLALTATLVISLILLAEGAFAFYRNAGMAQPPDLPGYNLAIWVLRSGSLTAIDLTRLEGVVSFPSFHAAMAVLFAWAAWPVRLMRLPLVTVNALMWLSAVPIGGHYAADVIAGTAVALGSIVAANHLTRRAEAGRVAGNAQRPPATAAAPVGV